MQNSVTLQVVKSFEGQAVDCSEVEIAKDLSNLKNFSTKVSKGLNQGYTYHISGKDMEMAFCKPMPASFVEQQLSFEIRNFG